MLIKSLSTTLQLNYCTFFFRLQAFYLEYDDSGEEEAPESDAENTENESFLPVGHSQVTQHSGSRSLYNNQRSILSQQSTDLRNQRRLESAAQMPRSANNKAKRATRAAAKATAKATVATAKKTARKSSAMEEYSSEDDGNSKMQELLNQIASLRKQTEEQQQTISGLQSTKGRPKSKPLALPTPFRSRRRLRKRYMPVLLSICGLFASFWQARNNF